MSSVAKTTNVCHVVAVPYPRRGHVNPMMCLCRLLAARGGVLVTFVVTEEWAGLLRASSALPLPDGVRLRTIPNVIPSEHDRAADFAGFVDAVFTMMEAPFEELLDALGAPPSVILADMLVPWAVAVGNRRGVPVASLFTMSASFIYAMYHLFQRDRDDSARWPVVNGSAEANGKDEDELLEQYITGLSSLKFVDLKSMATIGRPLQRSLEAFSWAAKAQIILFTTFYELEPRCIDALRSELKLPPVHAVGPCIPYMLLPPHEQPREEEEGNSAADHYLNWLEAQKESSVLYVSLGSFLSVSAAQLEEIAAGLRDSKAKFLWAARGDTAVMQESVGDMGLVVPWCDQLRVLCHRSVGGFLTHCGWNSTMEGVFSGVPMITFPIFWDQPPDSRFVVDQWKVGFSLNEKMLGKDGIVARQEIADTIRKLMDYDHRSSEVSEMRKRSEELRLAAMKAVGEGGSSHNSLNVFLQSIRNA